MPVSQITPVLDPTVRKLCIKSYPRHKKGCPNFNKKDSCPPNIELFQNIYDITKPILAVWNIFNLKDHVNKMRIKHPDWSYPQLSNCLYWQGHARKLLRQQVKDILKAYPEMTANYCPEAMGINITATMKQIGIILEWPPINKTLQIALLAYPLK